MEIFIFILFIIAVCGLAASPAQAPSNETTNMDEDNVIDPDID